MKSLLLSVLKVAVIIIVLEYWGMSLSSFAAVIASAGVAIGLALQGSLSNFAGGFIILLIRPFKVGDYVEAAGHGGTVEQIGLFIHNWLLQIINRYLYLMVLYQMIV